MEYVTKEESTQTTSPKLEVIHTKKQFVNLLTTAILSIVCKLFSPPAETRWEHWTTRERESERASYTFEERILNLYFLRFCTYTDIFAIVTKHINISTHKTHEEATVLFCCKQTRVSSHRTSTTTFGAPPTEAHLSENFPEKKLN